MPRTNGTGAAIDDDEVDFIDVDATIGEVVACNTLVVVEEDTLAVMAVAGVALTVAKF